MNGQLEIFESSTLLQHGAVERIVSCLANEILAHGRASFVLSGGTTPRSVYELLGSPEYRGRLDWKKVHLFWGDERCVGPSMPESNFRMAKESLFQNISIPPQNIHRMRGELKPQEAAHESEIEIRRFFGLKEGEFPQFTLILLGIGEDGHTASLFPGTAVLGETHRIVSDVEVKAISASRLTLTFPAINNAATIIFLVSGRTKAGILGEVLAKGETRYPAQQVDPISGQLFWLVDRDAASRIPKAQTT